MTSLQHFLAIKPVVGKGGGQGVAGAEATIMDEESWYLVSKYKRLSVG
jgi:hypothetical protein